jgi:serine carboxypeptidase-like clade 2
VQVGCSSLVNYSYSDLLSSMLPTYDYILNTLPNGRYLVFSGDVDGIVPFTGTRLWLEALGWPVTNEFHPYNTPDNQVAGWAYGFTAPSGGNLTFASVRNAGHLVPAMQGKSVLMHMRICGVLFKVFHVFF